MQAGALVVAYFWIGYCLRESHGEYWPHLLLALLSLLIFATGLLMLGRPGKVWTGWLFLTVLTQLAWFSDFQGFFHQEQDLKLYWLLRSQVRLMWASFVLLWSPLWASRWFLVIVVAQVVGRILVPLQSPHPHIDVFTIGTQGADCLLQGHNPYAREYEDVYQGHYGYRPIYLYWPTGLWLQAAFRALTGDIRNLFVAAEALTTILLYSWLPGNAMRRWLWVLLWLTLPAQLVVLEKAWLEPLMILFWMLSLWLVQRDRPLTAGISLGLLCGVKQTAVFLPLLLLPHFYARFGPTRTLQAIACTISSFLTVLAPFALANWSWFYASTIQALFQMPTRPDSLNLQAHLAHLGLPILTSTGYLTLLGLTLASLTAWVRRSPTLKRTLASCFVFHSVLFVCGKQAFLNYYVLLAFLLLTTTAECERTEEVLEARLTQEKRSHPSRERDGDEC